MRLLGIRCVVLCAAVFAVVVPATASAAASSAARSQAAWNDVAGTPATTRNGAPREIKPRRFRALRLDRASLSGVLGAAPRERTAAARNAPLTVSLPAPDGTERRFALEKSSVMAPELAAKHPEIRTYRGVGIDDPGATLHLDLTPAGLHASVRGPAGSWYIDPYYRGDDSVYASYRRGDLTESPHERFIENDVVTAGARTEPAPASAIGPRVVQRTYRLALVSDPAYATYHGGVGVTAAKATLINRVNQIYEDDFAIHLELVANNDLLNFNSAAKMTGADGPCGAAPCYTAVQSDDCDVDTLNRTRVVIGQLIGASNYDVGHIGMGVNGGGVAYLGVVGRSLKGGGCTGVTNPVGDLFAVDYVAHELGHQFNGNHTFNGIAGSCGGNIGGPTSVEPGSGSTIMAYAGICAIDNLQPHSDPYFSQRSIDEVMGYVGAAQSPIAEVQTVSLRNFTGSDSFKLTYNGAESPTITRGTNYTAAGIVTAVKAIAGFPASTALAVESWDGTSGSPDDSGFSLTFGGSLGGTDVSPLSVTSPVGATGFVGETDQGGPTRNGGTVIQLANHAPEVIVPEGFTIPRRTPFSLTGQATDADGDTLVYLWEQNDAGTATGLTSNTKPDGPLFRVFGRRAVVSSTDTLRSPSPGENVAGTSPTRELPDMAQILAGNTNAASGACPSAPATPPVPVETVDCYSEFLPTSVYAGPMHFRLTARDGAGGVAHDDTTLTLAGTNPFRVTSQATTTSVDAGVPVQVTWSVAGTNAGPVNTANVKITLSTDGGQTFPTVLSESTPNDGSESVVFPNVATTTARLKVQAVGNIFFDVNRANFSIVAGAPVATHDAPAGGATGQYSDAIAPVTVSATDSNTPGSSLTATAPGLPAGLTLAVASTSAGTGTPGSRTWTISGNVTAAPNTYPVDVTVADGAGHSGVTSFNVVVTAENATVTYTGDTLVTGAAGASQASATLRAMVVDDADGAPGDVTNAPVTFKEGATTLCTKPAAADGTATCAVNLTTGAIHHIDVVVTGRYTGSAAGDVDVRSTPAATQPAATTQPGPGGQTTTPTTPTLGTPLGGTQPSLAVAALAPNLTKVAARPRLAKTGRVSIKLACRPVGLGLAPANCTGTLKLTMRIKGKKQTIGTAAFSLSGTASKTVSIKLSTKARRALKKATSATLSAAVTNAGGSTRTATKSIKLLPRKRP